VKPDLKNDRIRRLKRLFGSSDERLDFLAFKANLATGDVYDGLKKTTLSRHGVSEILWVLLVHFSEGRFVRESGKLVRFRDLPGGYAYEKAFLDRAVQPVIEIFGDDPNSLIEAAKPLGGMTSAFGDVSVAIPALPRIPLTYILWGRGEFPASATLLFDGSASQVLPTEDLAVLAELATSRLQQSHSVIQKGKPISRLP
jgi:hypothetical protein